MCALLFTGIVVVVVAAVDIVDVVVVADVIRFSSWLNISLVKSRPPPDDAGFEVLFDSLVCGCCCGFTNTDEETRNGELTPDECTMKLGAVAVASTGLVDSIMLLVLNRTWDEAEFRLLS